MFRKILSLGRFMYRQRVKGFDVPDSAQLDDDGKAYFLDRLQNSSLFLEYGCGGSTLDAARLGKKSVSVESDRFYLASVARRIVALGYVPGQMIHADIGITREWGYPLFKHPTSSRLQRWRQYAESPWTSGQHPDLILIDGRFRVSCALYCISQLKDFQILFDDYKDRHHYWVVEQFAGLDRMCGRMAVFRPKPYDPSALASCLAQAGADYR